MATTSKSTILNPQFSCASFTNEAPCIPANSLPMKPHCQKGFQGAKSLISYVRVCLRWREKKQTVKIVIYTSAMMVEAESEMRETRQTGSGCWVSFPPEGSLNTHELAQGRREEFWREEIFASIWLHGINKQLQKNSAYCNIDCNTGVSTLIFKEDINTYI